MYGKFETDGNHRVEGIEKMKVAKLFSGIADILIAYCVGHCSLLGTAPFGTAIIGAGSACGRSPWMLLLGLLGAFFEQGGFEKQGQMIYPLIWVMKVAAIISALVSVVCPCRTGDDRSPDRCGVLAARGNRNPSGVRRRCARFFFYVSVLLFLSESEWG